MNRPLLTLALAGAAIATIGASAQPLARVSQKNRAFTPREVTIQRGGEIVFENDDGELLHHVHSTDAGAVFDTGELAPGSKVPVRFARTGTFSVRCLIHPRMLLAVTVR